MGVLSGAARALPAPDISMIQRRPSRRVRIGSVVIGGDEPIAVQSMTTARTEDIDAAAAQIAELEAAGCRIARVAVPTRAAAEALGELKRQTRLPLVADIHFEANLALEAIRQGADKVRLNPGNIRDSEKLDAVIDAAKDAGVAIRIGVNSGSVRGADERGADLVDLMVEKTLGYCRRFERRGFYDLVLSLKASDVPATLAAYRRIADQCDYPLHLGVTAAGPPSVAVVRSAIGIGALLSEGIGDTLRVSLTHPPAEEVRVGYQILEALDLWRGGPRLISCPTCGRCQVDLISLVEEVERRLPKRGRPISVAVMGCVVNGPGEARECDVGVAGGKGFGFLFKHGKKVRKVAEAELVDALMEEVAALMAEGDES